MSNITINGIITFDEETGLKISNRGEILEDYKTFVKIAYGEDYVIEQGNSWYSWMDLNAGCWAENAGKVQEILEAISFTGAKGVNLDNVVSFVGITRKAVSNSTVLIKATIDPKSGIPRPYSLPVGGIKLEDVNGNIWVNTSDLYIAKYKNEIDKTAKSDENYVGTVTFTATDDNADPTSIILQPFNDGSGTNLTLLTEGIPEGITFINETVSTLGNQEENDAQLRARYLSSLYKQSVGTVDGLISQIQTNTNAEYVYVVENNSSQENELGMTGHSIWVITDGKSEWDGTGEASNYPDDIAIGNMILEYKSLGCGTSLPTNAQTYDPTTGEGAITVKITIDSTTYNVKFSRAKGVNCYIALTLATNLSEEARKPVAYQLKQNIADYVNSLGINNDVLYSGVSAVVNDVVTTNNYKDFVIDIASLFINTTASPTTGRRVKITYNEYAKITADDIEISWIQEE